MSNAPPKDRRTLVVRLMAGFCAVMAVMCVVLAWGWTRQREEAACWRAAAEFQLQPEGDCRNSFWARTEPGVDSVTNPASR